MRLTFPLRSGAGAGDRYYIVAGAASGRRFFRGLRDPTCRVGVPGQGNWFPPEDWGR